MNENNQNMGVSQPNLNQTPMQPRVNLTPQPAPGPMNVQPTNPQPVNPQPAPQPATTEPQKPQSNKGLIVLLLLVVLAFSGYVLYKEVIQKEPKADTSEKGEEKQEEKESEKEEEKKEEEKEETVICNTCKNYIDFTSAYTNTSINEVTGSILLGGSVRNVRFAENGTDVVSLFVDDKAVLSLDPMKWLDSLYVLKNEVIMLVTSGSDIGNNEYYFFDKDLNAIEVNTTLDSSYPTTMRQSSADNSLSVSGNVIHVLGTRGYHNNSVRVESGGYLPICDSSYDGSIDGELLSAEYEMTYLGNNQFSLFKKVKDVSFVSKDVCNN